MSNERTIEYVDLYELEGDERNPKDHDVGTIDASMNRFGVIDPIVVDGRTQKIVSGHGRHKTLVQMFEQNLPAPDGVQVDDDTGQWRIPVYTGWASDNDTESAAALIALNRTTELGGWVDEELLELLAELSQQEDGLEGVGFGQHDIGNLEAALTEYEWDEVEDEDIEAALEEADRSAWPVLRIQVDPDVHEAFMDVEGGSEYEKLLKVLQLAGVWA